MISVYVSENSKPTHETQPFYEDFHSMVQRMQQEKCITIADDLYRK